MSHTHTLSFDVFFRLLLSWKCSIISMSHYFMDKGIAYADNSEWNKEKKEKTLQRELQKRGENAKKIISVSFCIRKCHVRDHQERSYYKSHSQRDLSSCRASTYFIDYTQLIVCTRNGCIWNCVCTRVSSLWSRFLPLFQNWTTK